MKKKDTYKQFKYKHLLRLRGDTSYEKLRILNFKRPKWKFLKWKVINNFYKFGLKFRKRFWGRYKRVRYFCHQRGYKIPLKWARMKFYYKSLLIAKAKFYIYYSLRIRVKLMKKYIIKNNAFSLLNSIESRPDILLWRAGFYRSPAIARFSIIHKKIYLNDICLTKHSIRLSPGDILQIKNTESNFIKQSWKNFYFVRRYNKKFLSMGYYWNRTYPSTFEVNWNTLKLVYLSPLEKNHLELYLHPRYLNISKLSSYLRLH